MKQVSLMARTIERHAITIGDKPEILKWYAFNEEAGADTFVISDLPFTPSNVIAHVLRADNTAIAVDGSYANNTATVTLVADCYHVAGRLQVAIYISAGSDNTQCVYACVGTVVRTLGDVELDSGTTIPTLTQLEAAYANAVRAAADAEAVAEQHFPATGKLIAGTGTSATADNATATGVNTTASGNASHAEGYNTKAQGAQSHAEGYGAVASGMTSHAEGGATASGLYSHAEGMATASGQLAHAENGSAVASGVASHAEGFGTHANHRAQHVFGMYNAEDPSTEASSAKGTYVEIVGNGTAQNALSNARTLDWAGNEALAGGLMLGAGTENQIGLTPEELAAVKTAALTAVTYAAQSGKTEAQKTKARENIGAVDEKALAAAFAPVEYWGADATATLSARRVTRENGYEYTVTGTGEGGAATGNVYHRLSGTLGVVSVFDKEEAWASDIVFESGVPYTMTVIPLSGNISNVQSSNSLYLYLRDENNVLRARINLDGTMQTTRFYWPDSTLKGKLILRTTTAVVTNDFRFRLILARDMNAIPQAPATDGTYTLRLTVTDGVPAYAWVSESAGLMSMAPEAADPTDESEE